MNNSNPPRSQTEFDATMQDIDEQLRSEGIPIHGRSLNAGLEYSRRFGLKFPLARAGQQGTPGNYFDNNVDAHIRDWFDQRYGDRQEIDCGPGKTVLLLRGDPWQMRLPLIYGTVRCVADRRFLAYGDDPVFSTVGRLATMNVLELVERLPRGLAEQLSDTECRYVLDVFREALDCFRAIEDLHGRPFIPEARADISAAVTHIFALPPHFGQSKWASCQATEKFMKCFLMSRNVPFPKSHDLDCLAILAKGVGLQFDALALSRASATPSVRYGEVSVAVEEAVQAHTASLFVGRQVHRAIQREI